MGRGRGRGRERGKGKGKRGGGLNWSVVRDFFFKWKLDAEDGEIEAVVKIAGLIKMRLRVFGKG
jgi:hypothetical protein